MEVGAAINMPPQATKIMRSWGLPIPSLSDQDSEEETFGATILAGTQRINFETAQAMPGQKFAEIAERYGSPFLSYHRADLHGLLRSKAEELGTSIVLGEPVVDIDCGAGLVTTCLDEDRRTRKYDLVVVADGINTSFVQHVVGKDIPLHRLGRVCYRTLIPMANILADETAMKLFPTRDGRLAGIDGVSGSMNSHASVMVIQYPCRNGELMNVAIFDRPREENVGSDDWNSPAAVEDALDSIEDFHEAFKGLVKCADSMKAFAIALREPLPTYVNDRVVLIGDAAHPMLPSLAGGGSTSLEDAATLGMLLSDVPDSELDTIRSRLELFNALRLPRDATQQVISNSMFKPQSVATLKDKMRSFYAGELPNKILGGWTKETCEFVCGYDVEEETHKAKAWAAQRQWQSVSKLPDGLVQHFGEIP